MKALGLGIVGIVGIAGCLSIAALMGCSSSPAPEQRASLAAHQRQPNRHLKWAHLLAARINKPITAEFAVLKVGTSSSNKSPNADFLKPAALTAALGSVFVIAKSADFWETASIMCNAYREASEAFFEGFEEDVTKIKGYHHISPGTHVKITAHRSGYCPGTTSPRFDLTFVTVNDSSSDLNGLSGVIQAGLLSRG